MGKALGWTGWEFGGDRRVSLNQNAQPTKQGHGTLGMGLTELTECPRMGTAGCRGPKGTGKQDRLVSGMWGRVTNSEGTRQGS